MKLEVMVLGRLLAIRGHCHVRILHEIVLVLEGIDVAALMLLLLRLLELLVLVLLGC